MNFDFSDDQKLLKEQVRKFLTDKCPTKVVRRVLDGNETHAEEVWKGLVELGVPGVGIPGRVSAASASRRSSSASSPRRSAAPPRRCRSTPRSCWRPKR